MSERDESATGATAPKPKRRKKKKKRVHPEERVIDVALDPTSSPGRAPAGGAPQSSFFAPQRIVIAGGLAIAAGLGLVGTEPSDVGRALWIGGLLVLVIGIHLLGRLGPDLGPG